MRLFKDGLLRANIKKIMLVIVAFVFITGILVLMNVSDIKNDSTRLGLIFAADKMSWFMLLSFGCYWMSCSLFGFLMKRNESDFYNVLPYKRKTMFRKNMIAMYVAVGFIFAVNLLVLFIAGLFDKPDVIVIWKGSFKYILAMLIMVLLVANVSAFAMSCSGNLRTAFLMTLLLLFGPRLLMINVTRCADLENGAMDIVHFVRFLNPDINLISRFMYRGQIHTIMGPDSIQNVSIWASCVYTAVLAVIYYILGERAYVKRDSEIAGSGGVGPVTYYFNKIFIGVLIMLVPICNNVTGPEVENHSTNIWGVIIFILLSVLSMLLYDSYIGRKGKKFKSLGYSTIAVGACSLVIVGIILGIKLYEWNYKLDPDKIEGFNINVKSIYGDYGSVYGDIVWVKPDKETAKLIADAFEKQREKIYIKNDDGDIVYVDNIIGGYDYYDPGDMEIDHESGAATIRLRYAGKNVEVKIDMKDKEAHEKLSDAFFQSKAYKEAKYKLPKDITKVGKAIARVRSGSFIDMDAKTYKVFKKEYDKLYDEYKKKDDLNEFESYYSDVMIMVEELVDGYTYYRYIDITKDAYPETYAYAWKQYVERTYDVHKDYLLSQGRDVSISAYGEDKVLDETRVEITYDQLLKILESKDPEPKYTYKVVVGDSWYGRSMYISSPVELKPYTD